MTNIHWEYANASLIEAQNDAMEMISKWKEMLNSAPHDVNFLFFDGKQYCIPNFAKIINSLYQNSVPSHDTVPNTVVQRDKNSNIMIKGMSAADTTTNHISILSNGIIGGVTTGRWGFTDKGLVQKARQMSFLVVPLTAQDSKTLSAIGDANITTANMSMRITSGNALPATTIVHSISVVTPPISGSGKLCFTIRGAQFAHGTGDIQNITFAQEHTSLRTAVFNTTTNKVKSDVSVIMTYSIPL